MPTVRVHHAAGLWLADAARPGALSRVPPSRQKRSFSQWLRTTWRNYAQGIFNPGEFVTCSNPAPGWGVPMSTL